MNLFVKIRQTESNICKHSFKMHYILSLYDSFIWCIIHDDPECSDLLQLSQIVGRILLPSHGLICLDTLVGEYNTSIHYYTHVYVLVMVSAGRYHTIYRGGSSHHKRGGSSSDSSSSSSGGVTYRHHHGHGGSK